MVLVATLVFATLVKQHGAQQPEMGNSKFPQATDCGFDGIVSRGGTPLFTSQYIIRILVPFAPEKSESKKFCFSEAFYFMQLGNSAF
ncbi:MAG: hypothetical protein ONB46_25400 [candidate division KSB1 bacterium]|nr:hypothetical protein [candidate division KSB1 bacterium]MDZ7369245.1 hypothetical protein [candidate division KSB1 bacterium]MDZ7407221.1 hypothetical protein [candidate division KSB1 bacterium]